MASPWYAAPEGKAHNRGSENSPWDLASALDGKQKIAAGDTLYLLPGTYRRRPEEKFEVRLVGTEAKPIHVRPLPGKRATIDGGLSIQAPSAHLWISDLEIMVSEPTPAQPVEPGSHPASFTRPWGGLHLYGGTNCKYINLIIHDCRQGISAWSGEKDCEIYGCLLYDNGWLGTDRGHGHCIYSQNQDGTKTVRHCIMTCKYPGTYTMHAYGSSNAYVDNFLLEGNIAFDHGDFLVGGGRPSRNIRALGNFLHGVSMQIGYTAPHNEDCVARDNLIMEGVLAINNYRKVVNENNLVLARGAPPLKGPQVRWFPNNYHPTRAHLAVYNPSNDRSIEIDATPFLKKGTPFRLLDPRNPYGNPLHRGTCSGPTIKIPMRGSFEAFVVVGN